MNAVEEKILRVLATVKKSVEARDLRESTGIPLSTIMSALVSMEDQGLVDVKRSEKEFIELTPEGKAYAQRGTPEQRLSRSLKEETELEDAIAESGLTAGEKAIALQWGVKKKTLKIMKAGAKTLVAPLEKIEKDKKDEITTTLRKLVLSREAPRKVEAKVLEESVFKELKSRKLVRVTKEKSVFVSVTGKGASELKKIGKGKRELSQLTPAMLKTGEWRGKKFREYDLETAVAPVSFGKKHAYLQFIKSIKEKLVGLGFQEAHGPLVELEFWNMDALFMAQDHPAREIHDVFQVEDPAMGEILDKELLERVKTAHERGLEGSKGWRYEWDPEIAARLVLRSQTTPVSARYLTGKIKAPLRLFCIGHVFRPDEIDWSHFLEFDQCEGIIADKNTNFRELLGQLKEFAVDVFGAEEARFAPSYFPFTEPSVELQAKIPGRGWAEVGGAGMFRPEMLSALGVKVPVLAWGLGLGRLAMIQLGVKDIRDLNSHDIEFLRKK